MRQSNQGQRNSYVFLLFLSMLVGCASGPELKNQLVQSGKTFEEMFPIYAETANVFIHRDAELSGGAVPMKIYFDDKYLGSLIVDTFFLVRTTPGYHTIRATGVMNMEPVRISVAAGNNYFWRLKATKKPGTEFFEKEGRELILGSHYWGVRDVRAR